MNDPNIPRRSSHPIRPDGATHLYRVGQTVRLRSGFGPRSQTTDIYRITGTLPPSGELPQYRIRNDDERHERVTTQDKLELVSASSSQEGATLVIGTFSHG